MTGFWLDETAVAFAVPKTARRVAGADIAKTHAHKASEEERWRYGVELRIVGSRWRPQTLAPHYPEPKPYVYRKQTQSLAWHANDHNKNIDEDYRNWLAERDEAARKALEALPIAVPSPGAPPLRDYGAEREAYVARMEENGPPAPNVVHLRTPALAREVNKDQRRRDAAALLRELAASYGPRRAHKLRAMADFITAPEGASRREA